MANHKFAIKVEHIKDLDMELNEFVSWKRKKELDKYVEMNKHIRDANSFNNPKMVTKGQQDNYFEFVKQLTQISQPTRYNRLQLIIRIGGE